MSALDLDQDRVVALVLRLSGPAILGISAHALQMLANAWFVADLGATAIATIAVAYPVTLLVAALGYGAGLAAASVVSRALGQGDRDRIEAAAALGFWLSLPAGLAVTALIGADPPFWLRLLGASAELAREAAAYTRLATAGTLAMLVVIVGGFLLRAQGRARASGAILTASFGLNILLDALLIRVLGLGTAGAGWAALLAQGAGAAAVLVVIARSPYRFRFGPPWRIPGSAALAGEMLRIGAPMAASNLLAAFAMALFVQAGAAYGDAAVGGLGLALRLVLVAALPLVGMAAGAQAVLGFAHGAGRPDRLRRALRFVVLAGLGYGLVVGGLAIVFADPLAGLFAEDPATRAEGARATAAFALAFMPVGLQLAAATLFQAIGAARRAAAVSLAAQGVALIPPLLVLPGLLGYEGVLASRLVAEFAADGLGAALIIAYLREGAASHAAAPLQSREAVQMAAADEPAHEGA